MNSGKIWRFNVCLTLVLASTLFFNPIYTRAMSSKPIIIRIVFIKWDLQENYFTIAGKDQKYTEVTFSVDYQIENIAEETITIEFANVNEKVVLTIITELENQYLNLTASGSIIDWPMMTNRSYEPGVENRSREFSFRFNTEGLTQLPRGVYNIKPILEGKVYPEKYEIASYGVVLEVYDRSYSIYYEHNEKIITSSLTTISGFTILSLVLPFFIILVQHKKLN